MNLEKFNHKETISFPPPLTLKELGMESGDSSQFCQQAKKWLGLELAPQDLRKSRIVDPLNVEFRPKVTDGESRRKYELMFRLSWVVGFENLLQEKEKLPAKCVEKLLVQLRIK